MNNGNETNISVDSPTNSSSGEGGTQTQIQQTQAILAVVYYIMVAFSLVGNIVVIKAIRRIGKTLRRQVHYLFIVNLSVADLLFALEMIPMICVHMLLNSAWHIKGRFGLFLCQFDVFLSAVLILTSNLTILAIAVEKFLGIFFPMKTFVSKKRAYFIIASTWLVSGLYSAPLFVFAHLKVDRSGTVICAVCLTCEEVVRWFIFQTILLAIGFVITLTLYSAIGVRIWQHKTPGFQLEGAQRAVQAKKHKALKMLSILVFVFYISFIPFWISQLSVHFGFYNKLGPYYSIVSAFLMLCNGSANPVIYSVYNLDIRDEFKSLIKCEGPVGRRQSLQSISFSKKAINRQKYKDLELNATPQPSPMIALRNNNNFKAARPVTGQQNAAFVFEDTRF